MGDHHEENGERMIPCFWVSYNPDNPVRCRWDEMWVEDIIRQWPKRIGAGVQVTHHESQNDWLQATDAAMKGNAVADTVIVVYPAGGQRDQDARRLAKHLDAWEHVILFVSSDEASTFPIDVIRPLGDKIDLWVMEPRVELDYSGFRSTTFIGCGNARCYDIHPVNHATYKDLDWSLAGQVNHPRREECFSLAKEIPGDGMLEPTEGFTQGRLRPDFLHLLARSKIAPAPSGICSQESFRAFEALTYGCVPLLDDLRPDETGSGFWEMLDPDIADHVPLIADWSDMAAAAMVIGDAWPTPAVMTHNWWHRWRRSLAAKFRQQLGIPFAHDEHTVVIATSPIALHPSTAILEQTVASIRQVTDSEILVLCDGVHADQIDRAQDYLEYVRRVMLLAEADRNMTPVFFVEHHHQSKMMRYAVDNLVVTPWVMFVEHDTPLIGDIPLTGILADADSAGVNLVRFHHESEILDVHAHMYLEREPVERWPFVRTMQWSQRPHIARTHFYRALLYEYFSDGARTMIEDVLHGAQEFALRKHGPGGWEWWRTVVYAPEGDMKRSVHTDGRGDDPKVPMMFEYPGDTPPGVPQPGYR